MSPNPSTYIEESSPMSVVIETGIPLPVKTVARKPASPVSLEIQSAVIQLAADGQSFAVPGSAKRLSILAGRYATKLGFSVVSAQEGENARIWRIALRVKKAKKAKVAVATA